MSLFAKFLTADGFLGTTALFHMDVAIIYIVALPFLMGFSLFFAINEEYDLYILSQKTLFSLTFGVIFLFLYGISAQGIHIDMKHHFFSSSLIFILLVSQIFISMVTIITWYTVFQISLADYKRRVLPGMYGKNHEGYVKRVFLLILLFSASSIALYLLLFFKI